MPRLAPVCLLLLLTSCATTVERPTALAAESPEEAVAQFVLAWNDGEVGDVIATFTPDRRATVLTAEASIRRQQQTLVARQATVQRQCHPRGAYWKTAVVEFDLRGTDRRSAAPRNEIVWLRLQNGSWWMYSL